MKRTPLNFNDRSPPDIQIAKHLYRWFSEICSPDHRSTQTSTIWLILLASLSSPGHWVSSSLMWCSLKVNGNSFESFVNSKTNGQVTRVSLRDCRIDTVDTLSVSAITLHRRTPKSAFLTPLKSQSEIIEQRLARHWSSFLIREDEHEGLMRLPFELAFGI